MPARRYLAAVIAIACALVGGGSTDALAGSGSNLDYCVATFAFVPSFAGDHARETQLVTRTCAEADQTAGHAVFSRSEEKLNAKLVAGKYFMRNRAGNLMPVTGPTYDDIAATLSICPKG